MLPSIRRTGLALALVALTACQSTTGRDPLASEPEAATGFVAREAAHAQSYMIAVANPHAARAGRAMLQAGGSAIDAAIAAQLVLTLVEPQSSGIGGGGYLLHWDAAERHLSAHDGRETAPAAVDEALFLDPAGGPVDRAEARPGGRSVGVPGLLRMLESVHRRHGRLDWATLFEPAVALAREGFEVSPRLHALAARAPDLKRFAATRAYLFDAAGTVRPVGYRLANPELANTLTAIADGGAEAFYAGAIARDIVRAVRTAPVNPGAMQESDLARYVAVERDVVCTLYRVHRVCGHGPSTSGGLTVNMILDLLAPFDLAQLGPNSPQAVHLFAQASRLAYADRNRYIGDPDHVDVPVRGLTDRGYLSHRAQLIDPARDMGVAAPGRPPGTTATSASGTATAGDAEAPSTTHISVVDAAGNAVSLTSSIATAFGSSVMVRGFFLNNQLTDFAFRPTVDGLPHVNRAGPGKRPRSSMSPTMVFAGDGSLRLVVGSPGGTNIIGYVAKTVIAVLDWNMDIQSAIALPHFAQRNRRTTELERGTSAERFAEPLRTRGHEIEIRAMTSGLHGIEITSAGLVGGADPRREGAALGD